MNSQQMSLWQADPPPPTCQASTAHETATQKVEQRMSVDLSDRTGMERQLLDIGSQIGYRQFLPSDHLLIVGHGEEYWRVFAESADDEELAQAIVRARYYAENLIALDDQAARLATRVPTPVKEKMAKLETEAMI